MPKTSLGKLIMKTRLNILERTVDRRKRILDYKELNDVYKTNATVELFEKSDKINREIAKLEKEKEELALEIRKLSNNDRVYNEVYTQLSDELINTVPPEMQRIAKDYLSYLNQEVAEELPQEEVEKEIPQEEITEEMPQEEVAEELPQEEKEEYTESIDSTAYKKAKLERQIEIIDNNIDAKLAILERYDNEYQNLLAEMDKKYKMALVDVKTYGILSKISNAYSKIKESVKEKINNIKQKREEKRVKQEAELVDVAQRVKGTMDRKTFAEQLDGNMTLKEQNDFAKEVIANYKESSQKGKEEVQQQEEVK